MAARAPLSNVTNKRASLAPSNAASSSATSMPNTDKRQSLSSTTLSLGRPSIDRRSLSRQSLSSNPSRPSLAPSTGSRRSSVAYSIGPAKVADPRPINNKDFVTNNIKILISFLTERSYSAPISIKSLTSPSSRDFRCIVEFLFKQIDINYTCGKEFEEEVKVMFKRFGYPFQISKQSLIAPGTPHTWPSLLAALVWFIEFLRYDDVVSKDDAKLQSDECMFYNYTASAYQSFLQGEDNYTSLDEDLASKFEAKNADVKNQITQLQSHNQDLLKEIATCKAQQEQQAEMLIKKQNFVSDLAKFDIMLEKLDKLKQTADAKYVERQQQAEQIAQQLLSMTQEKQTLQDIVNAQPFTQAEIQAMIHQKDLFDSSLRTQMEQKESIQREIWDIEMSMARLLAEVEKHIHEYNDLAVSIEISPSTAKHANGQNMALTLNPHATVPIQMLSVDLKHTVKPCLSSLRSHLSDKITLRQQSLRQASDRCRKCEDRVGEMCERIKELTAMVERNEMTYKQERETMNADLRTTIQAVTDIEMELHRMRSSQTASVAASEASVEAIVQELAETSRRHAQERDTLNEEICHMMDTVTTHKLSITQKLESLVNNMMTVKKRVEMIPMTTLSNSQ